MTFVNEGILASSMVVGSRLENLEPIFCNQYVGLPEADMRFLLTPCNPQCKMLYSRYASRCCIRLRIETHDVLWFVCSDQDGLLFDCGPSLLGCSNEHGGSTCLGTKLAQSKVLIRATCLGADASMNTQLMVTYALGG
jgi:hypothetical protein